jgi:hypothetical protein
VSPLGAHAEPPVARQLGEARPEALGLLAEVSLDARDVLTEFGRARHEAHDDDEERPRRGRQVGLHTVREAKSTQAKSTQAKSTQAKSSQAKSSQGRQVSCAPCGQPSQVKSSQQKSRALSLSVQSVESSRLK